MRDLLHALLVLVLGGLALAQEARPPADAPKADAKPAEPVDPNEAASERLKKPIKVTMKDMAFQEALEYLANACDVDIVAEWPALERSQGPCKNTPVTLNLRQGIPAEAALNLVLRVAGGARYELENGVVIVGPAGPPGPPEKPATETRVLDLANLIRKGDGEPPADKQVEQIVSLITRMVQRETWQANGGNIGDIVPLGTRLVIRHTEQAQTEIAQLILLIRDK